MLLNCGVREDSWESLGLQGDPTSPFWRRSARGFLWKDWCWSWNSSTLATWCEELTPWKRPWCWERLKAGGEGHDRGWNGWMASLTQWTWVWVNSGSWWWTGRPGMLQSMGSQRVGHNWATEPNGTLLETLFVPWTPFQNASDGGSSRVILNCVLTVRLCNRAEFWSGTKLGCRWICKNKWRNHSYHLLTQEKADRPALESVQMDSFPPKFILTIWTLLIILRSENSHLLLSLLCGLAMEGSPRCWKHPK